MWFDRVKGISDKTNSHRAHQREVITATLEGHDVFLQAATSFGKSLCFQLPAVVDYGSERTARLSSREHH